MIERQEQEHRERDERQDEQAQRGNEVDLCVAEAFAQVALREERADRDHRDGRIERGEIGDRRCRNDRQLERRQKAEQADEVGNDAGIDKGVAEALRTRHITGKLTYAVGPEQQVVHHDERRAEEQTLRAVQRVEQRQTHEAAVGEHDTEALVREIGVRAVFTENKVADENAQSHGCARAQNGKDKSLAERRVEFALKRVDDNAGRDNSRQDKGKLTGAVVVDVFFSVAERTDADEQEHDDDLRD